MSYTSRIDLKLGAIAEVEDEELFSILQPVYNALHLLNSYLDQTVDLISEPTKTSEAFSFRMKMFWAALETGAVVKLGDAVSMGVTGFKLGPSGSATITAPYGIVNSLDTTSTPNKVLLGWPPAIINWPTATFNDTLYAQINASKFLLHKPSTPVPGLEYFPIGKCVDIDKILLLQGLWR